MSADRMREMEKALQERGAALRAVGATDTEVDALAWTNGLPADQALAAHRQRMAELAAENRVEHRRRLSAAGVPELHLRHVVDAEPRPTDALGVARRFLQDDHVVFLVLLGGVGTGKTAAAARALSEHTTGRRTSRFLTADALSRLGGFSKADELEQVERCDFLVLDDLGAEYGDSKGWFVSLLSGLVSARYAAMKRTVITSNLDAEGLRAYGERFVDRLREVGVVVEIAGQSMRPKLRLVKGE